MESKKPLILIPPMSEPMAKLKEVLEGIAAEENIEIFVVEDSKEFGQLVGSGGQALVMMSNAKTCATLLQEYRAIIAKSHTKVILLTPKEIPLKTLQKFTKIGLTESILETSPPKTLLYKVKLLLRSIKAIKKEDSSQQLVKSMLDTGPKTKIAEEGNTEVSLSSGATEELIEKTEDTKRKMVAVEADDSMNYLSNKKGKITTQEEAIETHWKSGIKKGNNEIELDSDGYQKAKSSESSEDIDMYYRGKKKKDEIELEVTDDYEKKKKNLVEEESVDYGLKKHRDNLEELTEEKAKRKTNLLDQEEEATLTQKAISEEVELEIEKNKKTNAELEADKLDLEELQKNLLDDIEKEKKRNNSDGPEDLGGHLKGKIKNDLENLEEDEDYKDEKLVEESIEIDKKKKNALLEEELPEELRQKTTDELSAEDKDPNEGEVDHLDSFMRGKIDNSKEVDLDLESSQDENALNKIEIEEEIEAKSKKQISEEAEENEARKKNLNQEIEADLKDLKQEKLLDEESGKDLKRESLALDEESGRDLNKQDSENQSDIELDIEKAAKINLLDDDDGLRGVTSKKEEEDDLNRKDLNTTKLDLEKANGGQIHEGKTDKISTYYKTGESKNTDQDWDLKHDKKNTELKLEKGKVDEYVLEKISKKMGSETTIDYRQLKAEFDKISRGEMSSGDDGISDKFDSEGRKINAEDTFKVIEIGPTAFDFAIDVLNLVYLADIKSSQILRIIAENILKDNKGIMVSYNYNLKDKKFNETFNSYQEFNAQINDDVKASWEEIKKDETNIELFSSFSMPTWMCRSIPDNDTFWRDIEMPTWADKELTDKKVELVYPFYDGIDRMGYIHIFFPDGIKPSNNKNIQIVIEMARTVFLDTIQRKKNENNKQTEDIEKEEIITEEKAGGKVLGFLSGFLGKKKAG